MRDEMTPASFIENTIRLAPVTPPVKFMAICTYCLLCSDLRASAVFTSTMALDMVMFLPRYPDNAGETEAIAPLKRSAILSRATGERGPLEGVASADGAAPDPDSMSSAPCNRASISSWDSDPSPM